MACAIAGTWRGIESIPIGLQNGLRSANPDYDFDTIAAGLTKIALKRAGLQ
jgi:hypothetical protein